ncbi:lysozyme C-like [Tropilaelaps mercedesae]|uniref:lysozyme n=1 Tax=Tropilaelaps mercedesae TaxID=418985 RepID=A0A1V9XSR5_9ACAR|nr:lysozyme C-like [Tropilaelaps mercedesae]
MLLTRKRCVNAGRSRSLRDCLWVIHFVGAFLSCLISGLLRTEARLVSHCEVAWAIRDHTTIKDPWNIKQFVCIADKVSRFNTSFEIQRINSQRSVGLFQIPSRFYCRNTPPLVGRAGLCHKLCQAYLDDRIGDDALCASIAYKRTGFRFWRVWYNECYLNKDINSYIEGCGIG